MHRVVYLMQNFMAVVFESKVESGVKFNSVVILLNMIKEQAKVFPILQSISSSRIDIIQGEIAGET